MDPIYHPEFIKVLFDKMSGSYTRMNYITSFGFSARWRRQSINSISIQKGQTVADLMTGMGECWPYILKKTGNKGKIIALDFSEGMLKHAYRRKEKFKNFNIDIKKANVFDNDIPAQSVDAVISGFGIKTFSPDQLMDLAKEIRRILKPGGQFSLIDVSVPETTGLKVFYMFYLKKIIPVLGWLFLGDPDNYSMLGIYTENFQNAKNAKEIFRKAGLEVEMTRYFFGCATGIKGNS